MACKGGAVAAVSRQALSVCPSSLHGRGARSSAHRCGPPAVSLCLRTLQGDFDLSLAADGMIAAALFVGLMLSAPAAAQLSKRVPALRLVGAGLRSVQSVS